MASKDIWKPGCITASGRSARTAGAAIDRLCRLEHLPVGQDGQEGSAGGDGGPLGRPAAAPEQGQTEPDGDQPRPGRQLLAGGPGPRPARRRSGAAPGPRQSPPHSPAMYTPEMEMMCEMPASRIASTSSPGSRAW